MLAEVEPLGFPLVVKPDAQGSSLGVHIVATPDEFQRGVTESLFYDRFVLAETYIRGRELTESLIDRTPLPHLEIVTHAELFNYDAKYRDASTEYLFDTGLPTATVRAIEQAAVAAADALGTSGLVRVDIRLDEAGRPWVLELNSIPGMTERSLAPRAAAHAGLDMPTLCDRLVRAALTLGVFP
jgi:D-alanine-D-alanine ligase